MLRLWWRPEGSTRAPKESGLAAGEFESLGMRTQCKVHRWAFVGPCTRNFRSRCPEEGENSPWFRCSEEEEGGAAVNKEEAAV
ncbi:hypothetical protein KY289_027813 [Solanum tuberosum]|nr:hypothetical protein KY289_027813 [Solanum tuberosum]